MGREKGTAVWKIAVLGQRKEMGVLTFSIWKERNGKVREYNGERKTDS